MCRFVKHFGLALALATLCRTAAGTPQMWPTQIIRGEDGAWRVNGEGGWGIQVFYENDERARYYLSIVEALPKKEFESCVTMTTAGPRWEEYSLDYFVRLKGKMHYCVRTWWDRRILINLVDLKQVSDAPFVKTLDGEERSLVMKTLKPAAAKYTGQTAQACDPGISRVIAAAYMAGRMKMRETVEYLKPLEALPFGGSYRFSGSKEGLSEGDIHPSNRSEYTLRRVVQVSLRLLGEKPRNLPATQFNYLKRVKFEHGEYLSSGAAYQPKTYEKSRHERAGQLSEGMKPVGVLDVMGPPDVVESGIDAWRWDVDTDDPYSLVVEWDERLHNVISIRKVRPPLWRSNDLARDKNPLERQSPNTLAPPRKKPAVDPETKAALDSLEELGPSVHPGVPGSFGAEVSFPRGAKVPDEAWTHLSRVKELRSLSLDQTDVDDDDLAEIGKFGTLEVLCLHGTRVTDAGLAHLEGLKRLDNLLLRRNKITDKEVAKTFG